jgi:hypothetical protein
MPSMKPLSIRQQEYLIAEEPLRCDECGESIARGKPYFVQRTTIHDSNGNLALQERFECLTTCSRMPGARSRHYASRETAKVIVYPVCWENAPRDGADVRVFTTTARRVLVAEGYSGILEWVGLMGKVNRFIEIPQDKICSSNFAHSRELDDVVNFRWKGWVTADGVTARECKETHRDFQKGYWYLPAARTMIEEGAAPRESILAAQDASAGIQ